MKITIEEKPCSAGDGSIFFWFWRGHTPKVIVIAPSLRPGYAWSVSHPDDVCQTTHFGTLRQARQFALTAAVLFAHRRPIPIQ